jgi:hypothetical protein
MHTPIEAKPHSSATSAELGPGLGLWIGFPHLLARSFPRSSSSRHPSFTQCPFPPRLLVCVDLVDQTGPHMPRSYLIAHVLPTTVLLPRKCRISQ